MRRAVPVSFVVLLGLAATTFAQMTADTTELISISMSGEPAMAHSGGLIYPSAISSDGRFVAFTSEADDIVPGVTYGVENVYVRDRLNGTTEIVSVSTSGELGDAGSAGPAISADGRYVAFYSFASNFVAGDVEGTIDMFVHDRQTGKTELVNVNLNGQPTGQTIDIPPAISANGRYVTFADKATNLVPGGSNGKRQIYVRDLQLGTTERVSVSTAGNLANDQCSESSISADGRYIAFTSAATNLINGDTNGWMDVFVRDRQAATTTAVSVSTAGTLGNDASLYPSITPDGRYVAFQSMATNLTVGTSFMYRRYEIYVRDLMASTTERISELTPGEPGGGQGASISGDGRFVAFFSQSDALVPGTTSVGQILVRDRLTGQFEVVSDTANGRHSDWGSLNPALSADGRYVSFASNSSNLWPNGMILPQQVYAGSVEGRSGPKLISVVMQNPEVVAGDPAYLTVNLDGPAPEGGMWVGIRSTLPDVASPSDSAVFVPEHQSSGTSALSTTDTLTSTAVVKVIVSQRWDRAEASLTVRPFPVPALSDASVSPSMIDAGSTATGTIRLTSAAPRNGYVVKLTNSRPSYYSIPNSVTVPGGATTATFDITAPEDAPDCSGYITASHPGARNAYAVVRTVARKLVSLVATPNPVSGGLPCQATVTINIPAPAGGYEVTLASSKPSFLIPPASVIIPEGESSATFDVATTPIAFRESGLITASHPGSLNAMVVMSVTVPAMTSLSVSPNPILSGGEATATVSIESPAPPGGYVVTLSRSNPAMLSAPASVTIPEGSTSATFVVRATVTGFGGIGYLTASHPGAANVIVVVSSHK